jgi:hypothetical protein
VPSGSPSHRLVAASFGTNRPTARFLISIEWNKEDIMRRLIIGCSTLALTALPTFALADGDGALTGAAGGAVAGAVVGGPVGAAVGGVAGAVIGGAASGPGPVVVAPAPGAGPCNTRTTTTTNNNTGASVTRQTTDCSD